MPVRLRADVSSDGGVVIHGLRIRHAADGSKTSCRGRARSALNGLGVFEAGFAKVNVNVDEARSNNISRCIEALASARVLNIGADLTDNAVLDCYVADAVQVLRRV